MTVNAPKPSRHYFSACGEFWFISLLFFTGLPRDYLTGQVLTKTTGSKTNNKRKNNRKKKPQFPCYLLIAEKQEVFFVAVRPTSNWQTVKSKADSRPCHDEGPTSTSGGGNLLGAAAAVPLDEISLPSNSSRHFHNVQPLRHRIDYFPIQRYRLQQ